MAQVQLKSQSKQSVQEDESRSEGHLSEGLELTTDTIVGETPHEGVEIQAEISSPLSATGSPMDQNTKEEIVSASIGVVAEAPIALTSLPENNSPDSNSISSSSESSNEEMKSMQLTDLMVSMLMVNRRFLNFFISTIILIF